MTVLSRHLPPSAFFLAALLCLGLLGCGNGHSDEDKAHAGPHGGPVTASRTHSGAYPIRTVCTTGMVADLVKNIGGSHVAIDQLMGEGVDPHQYKASPGDVSRLNSADVIFYSGLHLEGKMTDLFAKMGRRKATFGVTEYLDPKRALKVDDAYDPHLWFDVSAWSEVAGIVGEALAAYDPSHADEYRERARTYRVELGKLHDYAKQQIATIAKERRAIVTAHDAFRYFGQAYDIEVRGIQGISTESEAGVKEVNDLVEFIVKRGIKAVFVESSVSEQNIKALLEGCKARGHTVVIGGELFSDAMGKPGTDEGTYAGMVRHNVDTIVKALR